MNETEVTQLFHTHVQYVCCLFALSAPYLSSNSNKVAEDQTEILVKRRNEGGEVPADSNVFDSSGGDQVEAVERVIVKAEVSDEFSALKRVDTGDGLRLIPWRSAKGFFTKAVTSNFLATLGKFLLTFIAYNSN